MSDDTDIAEELADDIAYPAFHPSVIPIQIDDNTIHIRGGPWKGPIFTIQDIEEDDTIPRLVELIDGQTHVEELLDAFETEEQREEVAEALRRLQQSKAVYDLGKQEDPMYPHMAVRNRLRTRDRERLSERTVLIVNASRMGIQVAEDLFEMGVTDIGMIQPIERAAEDTSRLDQWSGFDEFDADDLEAAIEASDYVVYTATRQYPQLEQRINDIAIETETPWVPAQIFGFDGIVGPAIYPGETACYECFRERMLASVTNPTGHENYRQTLADEDHLSTVTLPAFERAIAGFLTLDLLNLLTFDMGYTVGRVVAIDSIDMGVDVDRVLKLPRCDACGEAESVDVGRFVKLDDMIEAGERIREGD
ncbi:hypothetical protein BRC81_05935 [Halobacteriales archaeon QS_1_68_20]|nr:MAG: hypothetical protein BRC81_05935 [Halobacteriales archaeon QS_1_68_20]